MLSLFLIVCCGRDKTSGNAERSELPKTARGIPLERKRRFTGNYNREFNDLQDLHLKAALAAGISPLASRDDTLKLANELVRLPNELELYKMYELTHSIPFLVPQRTTIHRYRPELQRFAIQQGAASIQALREQSPSYRRGPLEADKRKYQRQREFGTPLWNHLRHIVEALQPGNARFHSSGSAGEAEAGTGTGSFRSEGSTALLREARAEAGLFPHHGKNGMRYWDEALFHYTFIQR